MFYRLIMLLPRIHFTSLGFNFQCGGWSRAGCSGSGPRGGHSGWAFRLPTQSSPLAKRYSEAGAGLPSQTSLLKFSEQKWCVALVGPGLTTLDWLLLWFLSYQQLGPQNRHERYSALIRQMTTVSWNGLTNRREGSLVPMYVRQWSCQPGLFNLGLFYEKEKKCIF